MRKLSEMYISSMGRFNFPEDQRMGKASGLKNVNIYYNSENDVYGISGTDIELNDSARKLVEKSLFEEFFR